MYLLDTSTLKLHYFIGKKNIPPYAILSHRWEEEEEVSFKDLRKFSRKLFASVFSAARLWRKHELRAHELNCSIQIPIEYIADEAQKTAKALACEAGPRSSDVVPRQLPMACRMHGSTHAALTNQAVPSCQRLSTPCSAGIKARRSATFISAMSI